MPDWTGGSSQDIWCVDLTKTTVGVPVNDARKVIKVGAPNKFSGEIQGTTFYMMTDYKAPRNQIVAVDLKNPAAEQIAAKRIRTDERKAAA